MRIKLTAGDILDLALIMDFQDTKVTAHLIIAQVKHVTIGDENASTK